MSVNVLSKLGVTQVQPPGSKIRWRLLKEKWGEIVPRFRNAVPLGAYSEANRPPIPLQTGHLFRSKPATVAEQLGHPVGGLK